jgi:hypothetical protein
METNRGKISTVQNNADSRIPTALKTSTGDLVIAFEKVTVGHSGNESDSSATKSGSSTTSPSSSATTSASTSASNSPSIQPANVVKPFDKGVETLSLDALPIVFEIKSAGKKGLGVFATVAITRGTTIMLEKPLLHFKDGKYLPSTILETYNALPPDRQEEFMTLASVHNIKKDHHPLAGYATQSPDIVAAIPANLQRELNMLHVRTSRKKSALSIFYANAMTVGEGAAVFMKASRINHSCVPNASYRWAEHAGAMQIRVTKDIPAGTEITISYTDPCHDTVNRRRTLASSYGFSCDCIACGPMHDPASFAAKSYDRRWTLSGFSSRDYTYEAGTGKEFRDIPHYIQAFKAEGLCIPQLAMAYNRLGELYMGYWMTRDAIRCFEQAMDVFMVCFGPDFEQTKKAQRKLEEAKKPAEKNVQ